MSRAVLRRTVLGYKVASDISECTPTLTHHSNEYSEGEDPPPQALDPSGMWPLLAVWFRALRQEQALGAMADGVLLHTAP